MQVLRSMLVATGAIALSLVVGLASAHHSFAMFDTDKTVTLEGTVKEFQWTNPHLWVQLMVKDPATGQEVEWSIEGGSPNGFSRQGWTSKSLKPGDRATAEVHPLKDGKPGASLVEIRVNGQKVGR